MSYLALAGQALDFISSTLNYIQDSRLYNKKKEYMKLIERLRDAEDMEDDERDDNSIDHIRIELTDFLSVWRREIQTATLERKDVASMQPKGK